MANLKFEKEITALLVIDPYNDFISEGGKFWPHLKTVAEANNCVANMHAALDVNIPNYAAAIVTTAQLVESIASL